MKSNQKLKQLAVAVSLSLVGATAFATNGYFPHGMGVKAKGMGGAAVAMTQDAFAGANNPAAAAFVGNRWDLGVDFFMPDRSAKRTMPGMFSGETTSAERTFPIPEFGYNVALSEKLAVGLTVYGYGGMNTTYRDKSMSFGCAQDPSNPATAYPGNMLCGMTNLGVDLMQLTIAPTVAYKISESTSLGLSPLLVYQRFEAVGLQAFQGMENASIAPQSLTNTGYDSSTGVGIRLGVLSKVSDRFAIGASYSPKTNMSTFDKYKGLFAGGGDFDLPSNWTIGLSAQASPNVLIALDYSGINYTDVKSVGNPSANFFTSQLGSENGPGFGWKDINVVKLGVQWQFNDKTTLRVGYNKGDNPIRAADATFNILAPGVMEDHYTLGGTYRLSSNSEWSWFAMYAPEVKVEGSSLFGLMNGNPALTDTIRMKQYSFGLQYSKQF